MVKGPGGICFQGEDLVKGQCVCVGEVYCQGGDVVKGPRSGSTKGMGGD